MISPPRYITQHGWPTVSKTAILLSGGLDSIALSYWKRPQLAVTVDYGQVCANAELRASRQICDEMQISHETVRVDCRCLGSGDLAGKPRANLAPESDWWPFRNQLLLTLAGMKLLPLGVTTLLLGTVRSDQQHGDGSVDFVRRVSSLMELQEGTIAVSAPAAKMTTVELVHRAQVPARLLAWGHSCHTSNWACGRCRGCNKHREVMEELGLGRY